MISIDMLIDSKLALIKDMLSMYLMLYLLLAYRPGKFRIICLLSSILVYLLGTCLYMTQFNCMVLLGLCWYINLFID